MSKKKVIISFKTKPIVLGYAKYDPSKEKPLRKVRSK